VYEREKERVQRKKTGEWKGGGGRKKRVKVVTVAVTVVVRLAPR
jgi:hypothetical protein